MENKFVSWTYKQQYEYKSFLPEKINKEFVWENSKINILLEKANLELWKLESFSKFVPDLSFFIKMHVSKEAIQSSRIEWTKTEFDDLFIKDISEKTLEEKNDLEEVQNYIKALDLWIEYLKDLPLTFRLFSKIHKELLSWVRWEYKTPWEIRKSQNWIGWSSLVDAFFIPPHYDDLSELITDFENFLYNNELEIPELIKIAIAHYQFETIHPYLDWNGRIGRLMIILYLIEKNIISSPILYISDFLEKNRWSYYDALTIVREQNNIEYFIIFILNWIIETCKNSRTTLEKVLELKNSYDNKILSFDSRAEKAQTILNYLYSNPIVNYKDIMKIINCTASTANRFLEDFIHLWILEQKTINKRNKEYIFENYLKLFR
mgnify:CR=1 FL=1